jgi:F-type H+-transporting ATPase subunit delta
MSDTQARISRYTQAIFQIVIDRWQGDLNQVAAAVAGDNALAALLNDPNRAGDEKLKALEAALPDGMAAEEANFVRLLVQEGDFALLPQVAAALAQRPGGRSGPTKADIISAVELTPEEQADLRAKLTQEHGEGLAFTFVVDPSLMGGLRVRVGDKLIDTSVASRLARLRESLASVVR